MIESAKLAAVEPRADLWVTTNSRQRDFSDPPYPPDSSDMGGRIRCQSRKGLDLQGFGVVVDQGCTEWSVSSNGS